jgi:thiosulfate/3-mercaptopyruvate sulfurtransferase
METGMPYTSLISATELKSAINHPDVVILDCRAELTDPRAGGIAYAAGHIPNAQHADPDLHLSDKSPGPNGEFRGRHPLPSQEAFIDQLRHWGVNSTSQVIVYDAHGGMFASRVWWMLRWVGHTDVALLDGGLAAWLAIGGALVPDVAKPARGNINLRTAITTTVTVADVVNNLATQKYTVLDARAADRFRGENETIDPVAGRIPGAKNRWFKDNLRDDGRFKTAEQLHKEFQPLISSPDETILQCGSGISACHNALAMEIAGLSGASLYPGSWSEWSADASRPVAVGAV